MNTIIIIIYLFIIQYFNTFLSWTPTFHVEFYFLLHDCSFLVMGSKQKPSKTVWKLYFLPTKKLGNLNRVDLYYVITTKENTWLQGILRLHFKYLFLVHLLSSIVCILLSLMNASARCWIHLNNYFMFGSVCKDTIFKQEYPYTLSMCINIATTVAYLALWWTPGETATKLKAWASLNIIDSTRNCTNKDHY